MLKKLLIVLVFIFLFIATGAYLLLAQIKGIGSQTLNVSTPVIVNLQAGQSAQTVWKILPLEHTQLNQFYFKLWLRLYPQYAQVKVGYYEFSSKLSVAEAFDIISNGRETQFSIVLVEGQTILQWLELLQNTTSLQQDLPDPNALYELITQPNAASRTEFCDNALQSLEGCLLAETYFYSYQDSALSILRRAYMAMDTALDLAWSQRYQDIPLNTPYEALILASIIEKETALPSERGTIAGVFSNRLELNMRLQTDPTVIYGIGSDFDGNITRAHLREMTPFNTYRIKGLPPTPIAMAGRPSLIAAVQPEITDYIYFVAKGDGSHQFSVTLEQHNKAVAEFQLNR